MNSKVDAVATAGIIIPGRNSNKVHEGSTEFVIEGIEVISPTQSISELGVQQVNQQPLTRLTLRQIYSNGHRLRSCP